MDKSGRGVYKQKLPCGVNPQRPIIEWARVVKHRIASARLLAWDGRTGTAGVLIFRGVNFAGRRAPVRRLSAPLTRHDRLARRARGVTVIFLGIRERAAEAGSITAPQIQYSDTTVIQTKESSR
jgi:hypothetical protein